MKQFYNFDNKASINKFLLDHPIETFDATVIGSSMAAASVVAQLLKNNKKILVIEKGSFFNRAKKSIMDIDSTFMPIKTSTREIAYGGTSNIWMGLISEFEELEYTDRWSDKPKNLWGIDPTELKECSRRAWNLFGIKRSHIKKKFKRKCAPLLMRVTCFFFFYSKSSLRTVKPPHFEISLAPKNQSFPLFAS